MKKKTKDTFAEFKKFINRGNVVDMAVGMVVGSAFTAIVTSLVQDVLNPIIGLLIGGMDLTGHKLVLQEGTGEVAEVALRYGNVLQTAIRFLLTAIFLFLVIRLFNHIKEQATRKAREEAEAKRMAEEQKAKEEAAKPKPVPENILLLEEIRNILKTK